MVIDPTITFGALLNAGVVAAGLVAAFIRIGGRIDLLTQRLVAVEEWLKASRDVSERLGIIETRLAAHETGIALAHKNIEGLRRGDGFIIRGREFGPDAN